MHNSQLNPRLHVLSSYAADNIEAARRERESAFDEANERYRATLEQRQAEWDGLKDQFLQLWQGKKYLACLSMGLEMLIFKLKPAPTPPRASAVTNAEYRFFAGMEGEERVVRALFAAMPDDWHVVSGYCNAAGETDLILVTPNGLAAIEVKSYSGEIFCHGNNWFARKKVRGQWLDKQIQDRGGRSPNQQVNAVADGLASCFAKLAPELAVGKIKRAVVFASENAHISLGNIISPGVDLLCSPAFFSKETLLRLLPPRATPLSTEKLLRIIQRDHQYHEARRSTRNQKK